MPKHLVKLSKFGGQFRVTLPKSLVEWVGWDNVEYVILLPQKDMSIIMREFIDEESLGLKRADGRGKEH